MFSDFGKLAQQVRGASYKCPEVFNKQSGTHICTLPVGSLTAQKYFGDIFWKKNGMSLKTHRKYKTKLYIPLLYTITIAQCGYCKSYSFRTLALLYDYK